MSVTKKIVAKHPCVIRWTHWVHFPLITLLCWSGLLIYWANDVYWPFFPKAFYRAFHVPQRLSEGMAMHFTLVWPFVFNGMLYVGYLVASGEWRTLAPSRDGLREAWQVALHDLGLRPTAPVQGKFNAAQRLAYSSVVLMGAGSVLTGLALYKPVQLGWLTALCGGYKSARFLHFVLTLGYVGFFIVHVAQVLRAGWNPFRAMVTGFEIRDGIPPS